MQKRILVFVGLMIWLAAGYSGAAENLKIVRADPTPIIDGCLDDPAWRGASKVEALYLPDTALEARDTTIYLAHDDKWLFVGLDCVNSNMEHVAQMVFDRDAAVQTDDSVELFVRPAGDDKRYYHFILNFANVIHDKKVSPTGGRDLGWNPPVRSMTKRLPSGWTAEIAIPLYILECDDLSGMQINFCRNLVEINLDAYGAKQGEKRVYRVLKSEAKGSPHDFRNYLASSGLGGFKPEIPFVPSILKAGITELQDKGGVYFYGVRMLVDPTVPGSAKVRVVEDFGAGEAVNFETLVDLEAKRELMFEVPAGELVERTVRVVLLDPKDGNLLASRQIEDISALAVIRQAYAGRNYYTSEKTIAIRLESGLPKELLEKVVLVMDVNNSEAFRQAGMQPVMTPEIPAQAFGVGTNTLRLRMILEGKELATRELAVQKLEPRPGFEVKTDTLRGTLLKDDQPFFPLGIFGHTMGYGVSHRGYQNGEEDTFKFLSAVGFNTLVRPVSYADPDMFLKLAAQYGMNVINWSSRVPYPMDMLKPPRPRDLPLTERLAIHKQWYDELAPGFVREAQTMREHRNMLGYYNVDEPNLVNPDERIAVADWYWHTVRAVDSYNPVYLLYARQIPRGDYWTKWGDVLGFDVYPCPFTGDAFYSEPGLYSAYFANELRRRCRQDHKAMMFVPLANMLDPARSPVGLSKAQMLCQAYSAIIYGARGLLYFAMANVVGTDAWDALRTINAQIKELAPALLNGDVEQQIAYTPDDFKPAERKFPAVNAAVYQYPDGDYLVLAVNIIPYAVETSFDMPGLKNATRLFEGGGKMTVKSGTFAEKIEPYGVRAYRLRVSRKSELMLLSVAAQPVEGERAPMTDLQGVVRQVMLGKNNIPNPCFKQQTNNGIPDFYRPYFCLDFDPEVGQKGSSWFVDQETLWEGNPALCMFKRPMREYGTKTRGSYGVWYPLRGEKPVQMTFSFYGKSEQEGGKLFLIQLFTEEIPPISLTTEWRRYQVTGMVLPQPTPGANFGGRNFLFCPGEGNRVWITGLQLEEGGTATEFKDDSIIEKKSS